MNIYVGNLSYDATDVTIREAFESFGEVTSARVIKDKYIALVPPVRDTAAEHAATAAA